MRSGTDSTAMQVVLALVLVSFVFWYSSPMGDKSSVVAVVNGTKIMDTSLTRRLRIESRRYERALSDAEAASLQEQVRMSLIQDEVMRQEALRLGLEVSDTEVARELLRYEIFKNEEGLFDQRIYQSWLRRNAYASRSDFEEELRDDLLRGKLRSLVYMGVTVSDAILEQAFVEQNTRVDLQYVRVRPPVFEDDVEVGDEAITAFLAGSTERVKSIYEADFDRLYNIPQKVELTLLRFDIRDDGLGAAELRPRLEGLRTEIEGGADLGEMARKWSEHVTAEAAGDMGQVAVPQLSEKVADAISALEPGQLSGIVVEDGHLSLYRLDAREPGRVIPVQEVEREIAEDLIRQDDSPALAASYAEKLRAKWAETQAVPSELLAEQGLITANTGVVSLQGTGGVFSPPPAMLEAASNAKVGAVLPEVYMSGDVYWVGVLSNREDADMDLFVDEKDLVREMVLQQRRTSFYGGWVDALVADASVQ
jgi:parvulin-like peptidyl-prolyl isomerase